ncbi:hypothetical protein RhiirA1_482137 [Rhizophagus irregularis]|uniref:Tripartite tricarboxylate transporter substrate binding protein n=1 Tax=Rhizophagus irregularis TaxID=588596 RepID=A0A2N0QM94_9GLOM|nr:hypothetical protein RhiirA1_482137 [Rhizophagus irregularis]
MSGLNYSVSLLATVPAGAAEMSSTAFALNLDPTTIVAIHTGVLIMKKRLLFFIAVLTLILAACGGGSSGGNFPSKNIELVAPATPGGGWDMTARTIQKALQEIDIVDQNVTVTNNPGGNGEVKVI